MSSQLRWIAFLGVLTLLPTVLFAEPQIVDHESTSLLYPPFWHTPFGIHRGTQDLLNMFIGNRTFLDQPQDLTCNLLLSDLGKQKNGPEFQISVLGANSGQKNLIYNPDLTHIEVIGDHKYMPQLFQHPVGVAMHNNGTVYITDPKKQQVTILKYENNRLMPKGILPPPPQGWQKPWGIALDSQGIIYVTDKQRNQILIYSPEHAFQKSIGPILSDGTTLVTPSGLSVVDPQEIWSFYKNSFIFVIDQNGQRILRTDLEGNFPHQLLASSLDSTSEKKIQFSWLELDYYENIWVTDQQQSQIHKFNHQLEFLVSYGKPGEGDGFFQSPTGIAIHRHFGQIFIADKQSAHYFWIGTDILNAQAMPDPRNPNHIKIAFFLTEPAFMTIKKKDGKNKSDFLFENKWLDSGKHVHDWEYKGQQKEKKITLELLATATYSSREFKTKRQQLHINFISRVP